MLFSSTTLSKGKSVKIRRFPWNCNYKINFPAESPEQGGRHSKSFRHNAPPCFIRLQQADRNPSNLANQEQKSICREIGARTGGDIYIGVAWRAAANPLFIALSWNTAGKLPAMRPGGCGRCPGRSCPIAAGRTIMTTEPEFILKQPCPLQLGRRRVLVRLIDCVG